jgi:hypothetical protein
MLIACPQSLHVIRVPPEMLLVVVYMPQDYASSVASAEGIRTALPLRFEDLLLGVKPVL